MGCFGVARPAQPLRAGIVIPRFEERALSARGASPLVPFLRTTGRWEPFSGGSQVVKLGPIRGLENCLALLNLHWIGFPSVYGPPAGFIELCISFSQISATMTASPPTTIERYFSLHYGLGQAPPLSNSASFANSGFIDTCIARHHNGLCVVCLSPRHPVVANGLRVRTVEYRTPLRAVRGKRKRGGAFVEGRTRLCTILCDDGVAFNVQCSVRGVLVEYNDMLQEKPGLVTEDPLARGYLAVVLPPMAEICTATNALCDASEYARRNETSKSGNGVAIENTECRNGGG